jgi:hypothetical protein
MLVLSQSANEEYLWVAFFLVGAEPGSGGCLDALDLEGTSRTRIAPTPRPPVERRFALVGFPDGLANQDSATPPLKLSRVCWLFEISLAYGFH